MNKINSYFKDFMTKESLFHDKKHLQATYIPYEIKHRDGELNKIAQILAPSLKLEKTSNLFIYGKTGTGKTLSLKFIKNQLETVSKEQKIPLKIIYINCKLKKIADTEYRLIAHIAREFGKAIPVTGLPTDEVYNSFYNALDSEQKFVLLILDEIDQLVKKTGNDVLYNLTRINSELLKSQVSLVGISNDMMFSDILHPQVKSSLSEEELIFSPYNAIQLQSILKQRAKKAFKKGILKQGVIEKCAAYAAREHGDARRALELLRVSGELAERSCSNCIDIKHIDLAEEKIDRDKIQEILQSQPKQYQAVLYSVISISSNHKKIEFTGDVYEFYKDLCSQINVRPLTQRRISDILSELDMLGIINAKVISKGRFGRTREITLGFPIDIFKEVKSLLERLLGLEY